MTVILACNDFFFFRKRNGGKMELLVVYPFVQLTEIASDLGKK